MKPLLSTLIAISFCVSGSGFCETGFAPERADDGISIALPKDHGFDEAKLQEGFRKAESLPYSHSLLVLRDGKLIAEKYFHGYSRDSANNLKSVSKSITSALVGIALDQKILKSVDEPVRHYFSKLFSEINDPKKSGLLLRHLLTMSAGFDANDDNPAFQESSQLDRARYTFTHPLIHEPGQVFSYSSAYADIVARIIAEASGMPLREFAEKHLFKPMGVQVLGWSRDALGFYIGESEIFLTSRDMAKFGLLFLNGGTFNGKRILSEKWVKASTLPVLKASEGNGSYGYFWWVKHEEKIPFFYAWGKGGQYIYVVPSTRMLIVMTNDFIQKRPQRAIRTIIEQDLIGAAKNS